MALNKESLGVPVIAIGIPTVVDAATMASDVLDLVMDNMMEQTGQGSEFYKMLTGIDRDEKYRMIIELLEPYSGNLVVTPKDTDDTIDYLSKLVANGINMALHEISGLTMLIDLLTSICIKRGSVILFPLFLYKN